MIISYNYMFYPDVFNKYLFNKLPVRSICIFPAERKYDQIINAGFFK
jgi:hypothetical protein